MKKQRHPFALAFSPKRMAQPDSNVRPAPAPPQEKKLATLPTNPEPREPHDILYSVIFHLLRHEQDGQTQEEHDTAQAILDCANAMSDIIEQGHLPSEELQYKAGCIWRLLEVSAERGDSVHDLMLACEMEADEVLEAIRYLQSSGVRIRSEISYESRCLELVFLLDMHQWRGVR
jgi:hypothetical protein